MLRFSRNCVDNNKLGIDIVITVDLYTIAIHYSTRPVGYVINDVIRAPISRWNVSLCISSRSRWQNICSEYSASSSTSHRCFFTVRARNKICFAGGIFTRGRCTILKIFKTKKLHYDQQFTFKKRFRLNPYGTYQVPYGFKPYMHWRTMHIRYVSVRCTL